MSYLVFARKWRPQTFDEVLAQDHITVTLRNAIAGDRIGHAYLMTGPRGVGKTTTARILAKALNCSDGPTPTPCQVCDSCHQITAGNHMDVREIDGASNRGIDQIRELREQAQYATASARYRIYIIDEVHMLTTEAFNALLKILEEPPDSVIFIFATTQPRKVPDTILSRCQRFDFRRIPSSLMSQYLKKEAATEGISLDPSALSLVCRASGGSLRDALSLMDQLVSFCGEDIRGDEVTRLLGIVETDLLYRIVTGILGGKTAAAVDSVAEALAGGYSEEELLDALVSFLRGLLLAAAGADKGLEDVTESDLTLMRSLAEGVPDVAVLNVLQIMSGASTSVKKSNLPRVVLESAVVAASKLSLAFPISKLPDVFERTISSRPSPAPQDVEPDAEPEDEPDGQADADAEEEPAVSSGEEEHDDDGASDPPVSNGDDTDPDRDRERETSQKILGLFDAV